MNLMTCETAFRLRTLPVDGAVETLRYATAVSDLGVVLVARSARGVCAVLIGDDSEELKVDLAARFAEAQLVADEAVTAEDLAKVLRFIKAPAGGLDLALDLHGTAFQRRVWEQLRAIPVGDTITYAELARRLGSPTSPRAVGAACAANPIALAVPCHRVLRGDGDLAGYRWGLARKRTLIDKETVA